MASAVAFTCAAAPLARPAVALKQQAFAGCVHRRVHRPMGWPRGRQEAPPWPGAHPSHTPRPALPRLPPSRSARVAARPSLLPARAARRATVQPKALAGFTEVAQLAEAEAGFIFGVSGVMVAITLIVSGGGRLAGRRRRRGGGSAALRRTDQRLAAQPVLLGAWQL